MLEIDPLLAARQPVVGSHPGLAASSVAGPAGVRVLPRVRPVAARPGGPAPPSGRQPGPRFLEAFHNLLHRTAIFYKEDDDTTIKGGDAFPVLNALCDVHLILSEGAHYSYGDLPWTARQEMLMQQWLLARPEFREFLPTRTMVAYPEAWMDRVDSMKKLQGWVDVSVRSFRDLAVTGEPILLSIRFRELEQRARHPNQAGNWARFWRQEVQWYIESYHTATGIDLSSELERTCAPPRAALGSGYQQPSVLIGRRVSREHASARCKLERRRFVTPPSIPPRRTIAGWTPERPVSRLAFAHLLRAPAALPSPPELTRSRSAWRRFSWPNAASSATSTLHLVWDVFGQLADERVALFIDEGVYATLYWGAERAAGRGVPVRPFRTPRPGCPRARRPCRAGRGWRIVVAADGLCPRCGRSAPVDARYPAAYRGPWLTPGH